jgi:hypothetical protein
VNKVKRGDYEEERLKMVKNIIEVSKDDGKSFAEDRLQR